MKTCPYCDKPIKDNDDVCRLGSAEDVAHTRCCEHNERATELTGGDWARTGNLADSMATDPTNPLFGWLWGGL